MAPRKKKIISQEPDEEQGILPEESDEVLREKMATGRKDEDIYDKEGLEMLEEEDEIDRREEAFMQGYEEERGLSKCAQCGKPLDEKSTFEHEFRGKTHWFCSKKCIREYKKELMEEKEEDVL